MRHSTSGGRKGSTSIGDDRTARNHALAARPSGAAGTTHTVSREVRNTPATDASSSVPGGGLLQRAAKEMGAIRLWAAPTWAGWSGDQGRACGFVRSNNPSQGLVGEDGRARTGPLRMYEVRQIDSE
jgi:hypothetical protein